MGIQSTLKRIKLNVIILYNYMEINEIMLNIPRYFQET